MNSSVFAAAIVLAATVAHAVPPSLAEKMNANLDHPECQLNHEIFDGTKFLVEYQAAAAYYVPFKRRLTEAGQAFKNLTARDRDTAAAKEFAAKLNERVRWANAMNTALGPMAEAFEAEGARRAADSNAKAAATKAAKGEQEDRCSAFVKELLTDDKREHLGEIQALIGQVEEGYQRYADSVEQLKRYLDAMQFVERVCTNQKIAERFTQAGQCRGDPHEDPFRVCAVVPVKEKVFGAFISNNALRQSGIRKPGGIPKDFDFPFSPDESYTGLTVLGPEHKKRYLDAVLPLYKTVGVTPPSFEPMYQEWAVKMGELKEWIDERAAKLSGMPAGTEGHYAAALAKKKLTDYHAQAQALRVVFEADSWKVTRKGSAPEYRTGQGWILTKVPPDKWCMLNRYEIREKWTGKGFAPGTMIKYYASRFQNCK